MWREILFVQVEKVEDKVKQEVVSIQALFVNREENDKT
jgi:hypothetical protein